MSSQSISESWGGDVDGAWKIQNWIVGKRGVLIWKDNIWCGSYWRQSLSGETASKTTHGEWVNIDRYLHQMSKRNFWGKQFYADSIVEYMTTQKLNTPISDPGAQLPHHTNKRLPQSRKSEDRQGLLGRTLVYSFFSRLLKLFCAIKCSWVPWSSFTSIYPGIKK